VAYFWPTDLSLSQLTSYVQIENTAIKINENSLFIISSPV
jgi:hypothetical protein